jgi:S-adenosylmethionine/arginine decarboxylase-like enzyme
MTSKNWWWGMSCSINLYECDNKLLKDSGFIKKFIIELVKILKMKRHGPTRIAYFGKGNLKGWSAMQFIKTSSITIHCDDPGNRAFIDVFSCKEYSPKKAAEFCEKSFRAKRFSMYTKKRI